MKRILIRAGATPFDNLSAEDILLSSYNIVDYGNNAIGNNNGNMLYAYSVMRTIMKDDSHVLDADHYRYENIIVSDEEIDYVNNTYDMYIIPLANAFRYKFRNSLQNLTNFIERIRIPVVVIGIGVGNMQEFERNTDAITAFVKAVLDKSALIGLRGNRTLKALTSLGFREDKEVTAIGCPSAYTFGPTIKVREPKLTRFGKIVFNDNIRAKGQVHDFLFRSMAGRRNAWYMPQMIEELKELYLGAATTPAENAIPTYPSSIDHPYFRRGKSKFFTNIPSWMDFVSDADFSIGARMHGNVIPILAGTPSLFFMVDSRMRDMLEYHHYPYIKQKYIYDDTRLEVLVEKKFNYTKFYEYQQRNFDHYLDFLRINGVPSIYDDGASPKRGEAPFDKKIKTIDFHPGVAPINSCTRKEMTARWNSYYPKETELITALRRDARELLRTK